MVNDFFLPEIAQYTGLIKAPNLWRGTLFRFCSPLFFVSWAFPLLFFSFSFIRWGRLRHARVFHRKIGCTATIDEFSAFPLARDRRRSSSNSHLLCSGSKRENCPHIIKTGGSHSLISKFESGFLPLSFASARHFPPCLPVCSSLSAQNAVEITARLLGPNHSPRSLSLARSIASAHHSSFPPFSSHLIRAG